MKKLLLGAGSVLAGFGAAWGYAFIGSTWSENRVVLELQLGDSGGALIDGASSWNASAESAAAIWNQYITDVQFYVVRDSIAPIAEGNGLNNVFFDNTVYGFSFGDAVAVTTEYRSGNRRIEADVIFNTAYSFNSYRGRLRRTAEGDTLYDLRRVAIHEFGHALGLDHPDEFGQSVSAIMNSRVSNIDTVQDDDIAGARALYGSTATSDGGGTALAEFTRPGERRSVTTRSRLRLRGNAKANRVSEVLLSNHRLSNRRLFLANGVGRWNLPMKLRLGTNRIQLYVDTGNGRFQRIDRVRIDRER